MKRTITDQSIDFLSSDSEWQIVSYIWNFWDWSNSSQPNPSHSYSKPWKYIVTLKADFSNNNVLEDKIEIEIIEDY
jgi:microbial collagenase